MGLLDELSGLVGGDTNIAQITKLAEQEGGLGGLMDKFRQGGLGDVVQSWIGKGENLPVSAEQIQQALGSETLKNIAGKFGVDPQQASETLSKYLPDLVHSMTPEGDESGLQTNSLLETGLAFLKGKFLG